MDGLKMSVEASISENLPVPVLLGQYVAQLAELLGRRANIRGGNGVSHLGPGT